MPTTTSTAAIVAATPPHCQLIWTPALWAHAIVQADLSRGALRLANIILAHVHHKTGKCRRSMLPVSPEGRMPSLPEQLGVSVRQVRRYCAELTAAGLLIRYQMSRHRCNHFQALIPGIKKGIEKIMSAVGGHTKESPPRTGSRTRSVGKVEEGAPVGLAERDTPDVRPSAVREGVRSDMRRLSVREKVVRYLCAKCTNAELEWLLEGATTARNPNAWVRWAFNALVGGRATPGQRRPRRPKRDASGTVWRDGKPYRQKTPAELAAQELEESAPRDLAKPPALAEPPPALPIWHDGPTWTAAYQAVPAESRTAAEDQLATLAKHIRTMSPDARGKFRRVRLTSYLAQAGVDLNEFSAVPPVNGVGVVSETASNITREPKP